VDQVETCLSSATLFLGADLGQDLS
jgi:hypothetical protein